MRDIKYEVNDDGEDDDLGYGRRMEEYEEYRDIVIEVDEKILIFISSFKIGSYLSLEVSVGLADKYICMKCGGGGLFYSKSLFEEHKASHSSDPINGKELLQEAEQINGKKLTIEGNALDFDNFDSGSVDDHQLDDINIAIDEFKEDEDALIEPKTEQEHKCEPCDETFV